MGRKKLARPVTEAPAAPLCRLACTAVRSRLLAWVAVTLGRGRRGRARVARWAGLGGVCALCSRPALQRSTPHVSGDRMRGPRGASGKKGCVANAPSRGTTCLRRPQRPILAFTGVLPRSQASPEPPATRKPVLARAYSPCRGPAAPLSCVGRPTWCSVPQLAWAPVTGFGACYWRCCRCGAPLEVCVSRRRRGAAPAGPLPCSTAVPAHCRRGQGARWRAVGGPLGPYHPAPLPGSYVGS